MHLLRILLYALICIAALPAVAKSSQAESMLDTLDSYIENHYTYRDKKCADIRAKNKNLELTVNNCQRLHLYEDIIRDYLHVEADSALMCADRAIKLSNKCGDSISTAKFHALRSAAQTYSGEVFLATVTYDAINPRDIAYADKSLFYEAGFIIYSRALSLLRNQDEAPTFSRKLRNALDSLNKYCTDPVSRRYYNDVLAIHNDNSVEGVADLIDLLTNHSKRGSYLHGQMSLEIARYYAKVQQFDLAKYYFTITALNNLYGGYNETTGLLGLGELLHREGDTERANRYLKTTLDRALLLGDEAAALRISQSMKSVLDDVSNEATKCKRSCHIAYGCICVLLLILLAMATYFTYKRNLFTKQSHKLTQKHSTKDYCIRQILALCAHQINAFEEYNRLVGRKIKGSQVKDLLRLSEEGIALEEQLETFHANFDGAFLSMYPDFVDRVNIFMLDDKKLTAPAPGTLSTELRFLALMHLGIDDYQQIATLLGITQNSVYTYKNKLKSRAIDRTNFEDNIRNIT